MQQSAVKLLLVDDVPANLLALEQLIEASDRQLIRANSGEEALEILLKEQDFAVILMDVQMPGLDGFDTVNLLRAKDNCHNIPVIFLTAFDKGAAMEVEAYATGAVDYVMKPIQPQILSGKVDVFVELYKTRQKLTRNNQMLEQANIKLTREISLREQAERQLRLADQAINDTHESVIITDAQGVIQRVNPAFCLVSGFNKTELMHINVVNLAAENCAEVEHALILAALHDQGYWAGALQCKRKNGDLYNSWIHISGIYNQHKVLTHYCAILSEVNDPQKTELVLRKVKLRLEQAQHISHLGAWEWNRSEHDIYCSDELFHILATQPGQLTASVALCEQFIHPDDKHQLDQIITSLKAGQSTDSILRLLLPDGNERIIHAQTEVRCNNNGELLQLIGTVHDITEYTRLEEKFLQAQKMEAVGAMVGGIAHEFNNILAGMNGHMYLAKSDAENSQHVRNHISQLETLSARAAETIQHMLTFSRKGVIKMTPICLNALIKETLKLHKSSVPEHISLDHAIGDDALLIHGDTTMIQQLTLNLIINARDALSDTVAPSIMVSLQQINADVQHADVQPGAYAKLTIRDNGCGIDADKADKIFEPFFTSKGNHGTGLGLSMVYGAVKSHHGFIQLESQVGKGSAFHIYLPLMITEQDQPKATKSKQSERSEQPERSERSEQSEQSEQSEDFVKGHAETILIADDEEIVRNMVRDTLDILGYKVITANDGQQALDIFSDRKDDIKLVILDVIMPKLGGVVAAAAIRQIQADTAIVFITGYNEENSLGHWVEAEETVIMKPFPIKQFSQVIAKALSS